MFIVMKKSIMLIFNAFYCIIYAGDANMCNSDMQMLVDIIIKVLDVVHFFVPIVLIVFCTVDIFKIIVSKKEDEVKKLRNDVFWKIIYAILIYLIPFFRSAKDLVATECPGSITPIFCRARSSSSLPAAL